MMACLVSCVYYSLVVIEYGKCRMYPIVIYMNLYDIVHSL